MAPILKESSCSSIASRPRPDKSMAEQCAVGATGGAAASAEDNGPAALIQFPRFFEGRRLRILHNIHKKTSLIGEKLTKPYKRNSRSVLAFA